MKDILKDLVDHTTGLDGVSLVKVTGSATETQINAVPEDKTVIISGKFNKPIPELTGVFGMPNLGKLKTILGLEDYADGAKISVTSEQKNGVDVPGYVHFETKSGDFVNDYRLMSKEIVEDKVKSAVQKVAITWNVQFDPTIVGIQRLKRQYQANSEEDSFVTKLEKDELKVYFGNPSTHSGSFVFHSPVTGALKSQWNWPIKQVLAIMDLFGDKTIRIADQGVMEITVDSGMAVYTYKVLALVK